jgi:hypothetical protein
MRENLPKRPNFLIDKTQTFYKFCHEQIEPKSNGHRWFICGLICVISMFGWIYYSTKLNPKPQEIVLPSKSYEFTNTDTHLRDEMTQINISNRQISSESSNMKEEYESRYDIYESYVDYSEPFDP